MQEDIILKTRRELCSIINQSQLLPSMLYLIVKDVYLEMQDVYEKYVAQQASMNIGAEQEEEVEVNIPITGIEENIKQQIEAQEDKNEEE